jgi:hypothetical protein
MPGGGGHIHERLGAALRVSEAADTQAAVQVGGRSDCLVEDFEWWAVGLQRTPAVVYLGLGWELTSACTSQAFLGSGTPDRHRR